MADDVMIKDELTNPCCIAWKDKYSKLKNRYTKLEGGRKALRRGLSIYEEQLPKLESENSSLKKALEDEKVRANNVKEEKLKESALRVSLESEVAGLKNEILSLKKKLVVDDGGREIREVKEHLTKRETKINELKELVEKERVRVEAEKKKAELERNKADDLRTQLKGEKTRADEQRRLADVERKRAEGNRLNLEYLKKELLHISRRLYMLDGCFFQDDEHDLEKDCKDGKYDDLGDISELVPGDYVKLLNLDNDTDEESYRLAIEMPLSPTLPEIQYHSDVALVPINTPLYEGVSNAMWTVASSGNFDVINVEINSNQLKHHTLGPPKKSSLPEKKGHVDSSKRLNLDTACNTLEALCRSDLAAPASEGLQISLERRVVSIRDGFAKYCVIFSNNNEENSVSSVYRATSRCLAQCSASSDTSLRIILVTLLNLQEISNREKTCVFFSLLLLYISETVMRAFGDDWERNLILFVNSVAQHIYTELSHEDTRSIFVESCNSYDVLSLMEDFLLHGKLLVHAINSDSKFASDSGINLILDGCSISLCKQPAPTQLLLTGGILLASVCVAVDHIGFICEASCNILRGLRSDALNILHIFAYLCGPKYVTLKEYGLAMSVVKSLVMLIHKNRSSPNPLCCVESTVESLFEICSGSKCPFSENAATMDGVASSLLDSLKSYACSAVGLDLIESLNSSRYGINCDGRKTEKSSDNVDLVQSAYATSGDSSQFIYTLALVELVSGFMSWDWMLDKIACPLLNLLEYCSTEHNAAAITTLLGQLGRCGLKAFGYEDVRIQRLRSSLCELLWQCDSKRMGLHLQFSIGIALIGLIPLRFEELAGSNIVVAPAANPCDPTDCLRKWFALLSSEQRLFFKACIFC